MHHLMYRIEIFENIQEVKKYKQKYNAVHKQKYSQ